MFGNIGTPEILLIVIAILILFGAKKIPEFAKGIGKGMKEFKKAVKEVEEDIQMTDADEKEKTSEKK
jgi:sec-independent protein translocase protein TatA